MIKRANINWSAKQYAKMVMKGSVVFDNEVQRAYVWDIPRRTKLISSMLMGLPVPALYAKKTADGKYDVLDGQQRSRTIAKFLNDEFALGELELDWTPDVEGVEETKHYDLTGKKFSELDEDMRDVINDYSLTIYYFENLTDEETDEMFIRLNNGKPFTTKEINVAFCKDRKTAIRIGKHEVFNEILSKKAFEGKSYVGIAMKIWAMLNMDVKDIEFSGVKFNKLINTVKITDEQESEIYDVLNVMNDTLKALKDKDKATYKKLKKEINFVSMIPVAKCMMDNGYGCEKLVEFCIHFFKLNDVAYAEACANGTARNTSIITRHDVLMDELHTLYLIRN